MADESAAPPPPSLWSPRGLPEWDPSAPFTPATDGAERANELAVLQAIFEKEFQHLSQESFEIALSVKLPSPFGVSVDGSLLREEELDGSHDEPGPSSEAPEPGAEGEDGSHSSTAGHHDSEVTDIQFAPCIAEVASLPPITLTVTVHGSYPSVDPPFFTLSCPWLDGLTLSQLCVQLDEIWAAAPCQVVVHRWAEWIEDNTVRYLQSLGLMQNPFRILKAGTRYPEDVLARISREMDARVVPPPTALSPKEIFQYIVEADLMQKDLIFAFSNHFCSVCFEEKPGRDFVPLRVCEHTFCSDCLAHWIRVRIDSGEVQNIVCPNPREGLCAG